MAKKVLIVDDSALIRKQLGELLDGAGYDIGFAKNGKEAVELTGIGDDGADGMVELKKCGAYTIGESEETAVVYGMPKEAYERGGVVKQLPFPLIVKEILKYGED